jgi:hypothetical protein
MPAFAHHLEAKSVVIVCPSCAVVPMHIKVVASRWRWAKLTLTYECTNCGAEVTELMTEPELLH